MLLSIISKHRNNRLPQASWQLDGIFLGRNQVRKNLYILSVLGWSIASVAFAQTTVPGETNTLKQIIAIQEARLAAQDSRIAALEKKIEGLRSNGDVIYFKDKPLAAVENGNLMWKGSSSGLKGDKGDTGDKGSKGDKGDKGDAGTAGRDGTQICGRPIKIRTGVRDGRGDTWLSLGWGVATTDARSSHPNTVNYLECP